MGTLRASSRARGLPWQVAALVLGAAACAPDRTMLVVRIESDLAIPDVMDSVRVVVTHAGQQLQVLPFSLKPGAHVLPLQVGLLSPSGGGADVEIDVSGSLGSTFVVGQDAVTSFLKGKSLVLDMFLAAECVGFDCHDPNKTCTKGQVCVDKERVADTLPPFDPHPPHAASDAASGGASGSGGDSDAGDGSTSTDGALRGDSAAGSTGGMVVEAGPEAPLDGPADRTFDAPPEVMPGCVPKTEDCYNGVDDDCDGLPDCADPDCAPTTVCVPRPTGLVGTTIANGTCPAGFAPKSNTGTPFGLTVDGGGTSCAGCQCGQSVVTSCTSTLTTYVSIADCQAGTNGKNVATVSTGGADPCPVPDTSTANVYGAALSAWTVASSTCVASGAPVRPTAAFATGLSFCMSAYVGELGQTGCPTGSVCMRRPPAGNAACALLDDASACPAGTKTTLVYAGLQDNRTCAPCACDLQGASCDSLVLQMGSDYGCGLDTADIHGGARTCTTTQPASGVYTPGYHLAGTPTNGTCKPVGTLAGTIAPTGGRALCCLP
jgi:hypothetical protein